MPDVSEKVFEITVQVLGPASRRFLERQTKFHLNGLEFDNITREHIPELAKWVGISAQLIVDEKKVTMLVDKIKKVG
jgi:hypothetical protein